MCEGDTVLGEGLAKTCCFAAELHFCGLQPNMGPTFPISQSCEQGKMLAQQRARHKINMLAKITGFRVGNHRETTTLGFTAPAQPSVLSLLCTWGHLCPPSFSKAAGLRKK